MGYLDSRKTLPSGEPTVCNGKIHHAINGKIHELNGPFSIAMLVHQRVHEDLLMKSGTYGERPTTKSRTTPESKQKGLLPALKSPIVCLIHYMILCFLLSMHKPLLLEIQTGLLWARKRQFVSPNTLHDLYKAILAFCCPCASLF